MARIGFLSHSENRGTPLAGTLVLEWSYELVRNDNTQ
ncbi:Uncharacterised protein [Campylobacter hyointestinalis subsp. hyointestinalis]|uniref:Uncharacterized protein n=1 Tax=Campylobacter hyointestinalis subsp. hyointestinalis TaxID=91352 RepID=A0A0S4SW81_CAMHY|nr:Uncharacterised protein [Campylobacter hyointestinalis subsp. hyointestinalis]CUU84082.1 Uncharacterised protein [Campylobacter hyointestinalis subsp. hyointestinalis]CUU89635.1 Uncharacterised protein [Campylobacter hyointestinalis subsp. hyointestinalis]